MKKETGDASVEAQLNPGQFPRIHQLARISFFMGIGVIVGGIYITFAADHDEITLGFLLALVLASAFGAFCGHFSCRQIRARRPHQKGTAIAVIGFSGCYVCLGWSLFIFWVLMQGTV